MATKRSWAYIFIACCVAHVRFVLSVFYKVLNPKFVLMHLRNLQPVNHMFYLYR